MDFNRKLENLLRDIREIENDAVDVSNAQEISKLEMDLLMDKVRRLYDQLIYIDRHYAYPQVNNRQEIPFEVTGKQAPRQKKQEDPSAPMDRGSSGQEQESQPEPTGQSEAESKRQPTKQQETSSMKPHSSQEGLREKPSAPSERESEKGRQEEASGKEPAEKKSEGPEIVADKYQNSRTFRHDDLAAKQPQNNLSTRMQSRPINDLAKAIGLNDKFLFVRELFEGDKEKYHEAIQIINEMPNFEQAQAYINERFNWDEEQPEVKKFMDLVRRKFSLVQ